MKKWYVANVSCASINLVSKPTQGVSKDEHLTKDMIVCGGIYKGLAYFTNFQHAQIWLLNEITQELIKITQMKEPHE